MADQQPPPGGDYGDPLGYPLSTTQPTPEQRRAIFSQQMQQAAARGDKITGLLVDYHLDRGNGIAAIRELRRKYGRNIPAILITADRSPHVRAAAAQEKIAVLNKPVKPASLRALLGQWRTQQMAAAE